MAESPQGPGMSEIPHAVTRAKEGRKLPLIWLVPLVAVLAGGWLAIKTVLERGPTITISFKTADGLEAGKTKLKYKAVDIGLIKEIALTKDRSGVVATAELTRESESLLVDDTRFWAVRPRITATGVSGLGTLLSGAYIALDPGGATQKRRAFVALEEEPLVTHEEPGREFVLRAETLGSHDVGVPVYFRRLPVGEVVARELDKDGKGVSIRIFVSAPYDQYVTTQTRFWNATGIDIAFDAAGFRVQTESLTSILIGGIAFQTRPDAEVAPAADAKAVFRLFRTREEAMKRPDVVTRTLLVVFRQSVRGLSVGAPVDFRGVDIGEVTRIGLEFEPTAGNFVQPVEIDIYPERLRVRSRDSVAVMPAPQTEAEWARRLQQMVDLGLRAQLRTGNLLTGQSYVALDINRNAAKVKFDTAKSPLEIPTIPGALDDLQESIASIAKKIEKVDFQGIDAGLRKTLSSLDQALKSVDHLVQRVDAELVAETRAAVQSARSAIESAERSIIAPDAVLQQDTRDALRELARAAEAIRTLADHLDRRPESLIRGRQEAP